MLRGLGELMRKLVSTVFGVAAFLLTTMPANAALFYYADATALDAALGITTAPNTWLDAVYSDESNVDVGNQNPGTVETVLESAAWFNTSLSFVGGGACGSAPTFTNNCTQQDLGGGNSNKTGESNLTANVFGVHFGNRFIAFIFENPVNGFEIFGLRFGVSNIYAFNSATTPEVPIPGAIWLMGAGLAGLQIARKKKKSA